MHKTSKYEVSVAFCDGVRGYNVYIRETGDQFATAIGIVGHAHTAKAALRDAALSKAREWVAAHGRTADLEFRG